MAQTTARIKKNGKNFEIMVDLDKAVSFRKGDESASDFFDGDAIFSDAKKGERVSGSDLKSAFGTEDVDEVAKVIVKDGEVLLTQDYRDEEKDQKMNQAVNYFVTNAVDSQTGQPFTEDRIRTALKEAGVNLKNVPVEDQAMEILEKLSKIVPIKLETKKVKLVIPAAYTGGAYGVINPYKEDEKWLDNGDLEVTVAVPSGALFGFYDKLNSITHGACVSEEVNE